MARLVLIMSLLLAAAAIEAGGVTLRSSRLRLRAAAAAAANPQKSIAFPKGAPPDDYVPTVELIPPPPDYNPPPIEFSTPVPAAVQAEPQKAEPQKAASSSPPVSGKAGPPPGVPRLSELPPVPAAPFYTPGTAPKTQSPREEFGAAKTVTIPAAPKGAAHMAAQRTPPGAAGSARDAGLGGLSEAAQRLASAAEQAAEAPTAQPAALVDPATTPPPVAPPKPPKVFFLFLAVNGISNLPVWQLFFQSAPIGSYKAFVHCKSDLCVNQLQSQIPLAAGLFEVVPRVPSYYCTDLVSPMNQLLNHALQSDPVGSPNDKFVYVSDSSLPVKPYHIVHAALVARPTSDFCVFPSAEWADAPDASGGKNHIAAVKHHQWLSLDRAHAETALRRWGRGEQHGLMGAFRMNHDRNTDPLGKNNYMDGRNYGCLDEFWHFATVMGTLKVPPPGWGVPINSTVPLEAFEGSPLQVGPGIGWQGKCDTFVLWSTYLESDNAFHRLVASLDPVSQPHRGNAYRPGWWDTISLAGMRALRWSEFLFARKFIDKPRLVDGPDFVSAYVQEVLTV